MLIAGAIVATLTATSNCRPVIPRADDPVDVPITVSNATFKAAPKTVEGNAVRLVLDSGGGQPTIFADSAARVAPQGALRFTCSASLPVTTRFSVAPASLRAQDPIEGRAIDGFLGGTWFDGHVWTWDYPHSKLLLRAPGHDPRVAPTHVAPLFFQTRDGEHTDGFARIAATIDGQAYQFLLDTGAHTRVTPEVQRARGFPALPFATSFIEERIVERWHRAHPSWPYVPHAEMYTRAAMIQAPSVVIGGYRTGPCWFTSRRNASYDRFMSSLMDAPVVGSIGGNALRKFRVTIDYQKQRAFFERP